MLDGAGSVGVFVGGEGSGKDGVGVIQVRSGEGLSGDVEWRDVAREDGGTPCVALHMFAFIEPERSCQICSLVESRELLR